MKRTRLAPLILCILGCSSGAATSAAPAGILASTPAPSPVSESTAIGHASQSADAHPVIGLLRTRDRRVTLLAAHDGLRVSVEDESGTPLARNVPVEALREVDPLLYDMCRSSVASNHYYLDARLDLPVRRGAR